GNDGVNERGDGGRGGDTKNKHAPAPSVVSPPPPPIRGRAPPPAVPIALSSRFENSTRFGTGDVVPVVSKAVSARPTRNASGPCLRRSSPVVKKSPSCDGCETRPTTIPRCRKASR